MVSHVISADAIGARPFLKWPGGKRWIVRHLLELLDGLEYCRYYEPFLGGGALFFALQPTEAVLSDINRDLINTYQLVRSNAAGIVENLKEMTVDQETYYRVRAMRSGKKVDKAARFLYLNRTAFGGVYRLNRQGEFNVPFGGGERTPEVLWRTDLLKSAARSLKTAVIRQGDFEQILVGARGGDLIYCDPTYTVAHANNGFVRYNETNFRWEDQKRLAAVCRRLRSRGCTVLVSNASHESVRKAFEADEVHVFSRSSNVCPKAEKRQRITEDVFVFHP